jgi:hypothetical protein
MMVSDRRGLMALLAVAVGVVLAVGGGTMAAAPGTATTPEGLDHFKCYTAKQTPPFRPRKVAVKDQFVSGKTIVQSVRVLCNPVRKDESKVLHERAHLICYQTLDSGIDFKRQKVSVTNQFGKLELVVVRPESLCVPSLKSKGTTPPPPMPSLPKLVDHFRCYAVEPVKAPKEVQLTDQFTSTRSSVVTVVRLCNPVRKGSGRVVRPKAHLVCYSITESKHFRVLGVHVRNQFGVASLRVLKPVTLCVPSFKERLG